MTESIYDFTVQLNDSTPIPLANYRNSVLLIVNVASRCGFTPQYAELQKLYQMYHDKGFEVLAFPCNQFGAQEPGNNEEIRAFCDTNYSISFPLFSKIEVNGDNAHPLYNFLKRRAAGLFGSRNIKWNFTKFLVDRSGKVVGRYAPQTKPQELVGHIETLL